MVHMIHMIRMFVCEMQVQKAKIKGFLTWPGSGSRFVIKTKVRSAWLRTKQKEKQKRRDALHVGVSKISLAFIPPSQVPDRNGSNGLEYIAGA